LWQLAISYGVKINDIKQLNNLFGNDIYPGDKLLIKKETAPMAVLPTTTSEVEMTITASPSATLTPTVVMTVTQTPVHITPQKRSSVMRVAIAIIVFAILGGGILAWMGSSKQTRIT